MTQADDGELRALQARAYGPHADIQLDPAALRRLRELEGKAEGRVEAVPATVPQFVPPAAPVVAPSPGAAGATAGPSARSMKGRRPRVLLIVAVLVLAAALVVAALLLSRRAQGDPVQPGVRQIAQLPVDAEYKAPPFVDGFGATQGIETRGYREFHGLRAVVTTDPADVGTGTAMGDPCVMVYPAGEADARSTTFSGHLWSGCAAGAFPATAQFRVTSDLPADVRAGFPSGEALQFVYDSAHNDVVVYATR